MFDVRELAKGSPEQQQALCEIAARIHKAERKRAALAEIAVAGYEPGADPEEAAAFVADMNAASGIYEKAYAQAVETAFESLTGSTMQEMTERLIGLLEGRGITGFALDRDNGDIVAMGPDGLPVDSENDIEAAFEMAETMLHIPGMVPDEIRAIVEARIASRKAQMQTEAADDSLPEDSADTSWLDGIDLASAPTDDGVRDFDGNVE